MTTSTKFEISSERDLQVISHLLKEEWRGTFRGLRLPERHYDLMVSAWVKEIQPTDYTLVVARRNGVVVGYCIWYYTCGMRATRAYVGHDVSDTKILKQLQETCKK